MKPRFDFANLKDSYLEGCGTAGGHPEGFRDFSRDYARRNASGIPDRVELFVIAASAAWRNKIKVDPTTGDLMLDGKACPGEVSYQDKTAPGGYTTVKFTYCSLEQFRRHCVEQTRNANAVQAAAIKEWQMYEVAAERATSRDALMIDLLDEALAEKAA